MCGNGDYLMDLRLDVVGLFGVFIVGRDTWSKYSYGWIFIRRVGRPKFNRTYRVLYLKLVLLLREISSRSFDLMIIHILSK